MSEHHDSILTILRELERLQTLPLGQIESNDTAWLPRMIGVGNGRVISSSKKVDEAISDVADLLLEADPALRKKTTLKEWRGFVRNSFGPVLLNVERDAPADEQAAQVLAEIRHKVANYKVQHDPRQHAFGCTLFDEKNVSPFSIGPVRFEPRLHWLDRKHNEGSVSNVTFRRVRKAWAGWTLRKRQPSLDDHSEHGILRTVGDCPYVCSVSVKAVAPEAGREKALLAARLALTALSLTWESPSKALCGMNLLYDGPPHIRYMLTSFRDQPCLASSERSLLPHALARDSIDWNAAIREREALYKFIGENLEGVIDPELESSRPALLNTFSHALLWFHEGCRETTKLLAVVNYVSVLDTLACGEGARGIKKLITMQLGTKYTDPITPGGPTMNSVVNRLYGQGRSRTVHGNNDKFGHDWSDDASLAEALARHCLMACVHWAAANPTSDDPGRFSNSATS